MQLTQHQPQPRHLKTTRSLCPVCKTLLTADVIEHGGKVFLNKTCPDHGDYSVLISSDAQWYFHSVGQNNDGPGSDCCGTGCCSPGPAADGSDDDTPLIERASTCIALIEIVTSCNLACPTCYAASPHKPHEIDALPVSEIKSRIDAVIQRKGKLDILQLSGGEPTIHPGFFTILEWALTHDGVGYTLLNTNGVRLDREPEFFDRVAELRERHGRFELYLQFDGNQSDGQQTLRGADLRPLKQRVIQRCREHNIPITLAMTVTDDNYPRLGETVRFALGQPAVRGITFQPEFTSGRTTRDTVPLTINERPAGPVHLNVADLIHGLIDQSDGLLTAKDFTPLPCGDPNCHTVGHLIRREGQAYRVSDFIDFSEYQGFLKNRVNFDIEDLIQCGCESEELGHLLKSLEVGPDDVLRLFIKPFMDAWTYDQDRIDRCCVHVVGEDGQLDSFCRHYALRGAAAGGAGAGGAGAAGQGAGAEAGSGLGEQLGQAGQEAGNSLSDNASDLADRLGDDSGDPEPEPFEAVGFEAEGFAPEAFEPQQADGPDPGDPEGQGLDEPVRAPEPEAQQREDGPVANRAYGDEPTVLGVHSNQGPGLADGAPGSGHAWISVSRNGQTTSYGLWPNGHPLVEQGGQQDGFNGSGTHVRRAWRRRAGLNIRAIISWTPIRSGC